jgi:hypothetical protein
MIIQEEREEPLASARRLPTTVQIQLPDRAPDKPAYVRTDANASTTNGAAPATNGSTQTATTEVAAANTSATPKQDSLAMKLVPIDSSVKTLQIKPTSDTSNGVQADVSAASPPQLTRKQATEPSAVELSFGSDLPTMKAGEKVRIPVMVKATGQFRSAVFGLKFDDKKLAVRSVLYGEVFGMGVANTIASPFLNQSGKMYVSLSAGDKSVTGTDGVLAFVEIEALVDGTPVIALEKEVLNFLAADGNNLPVRF